MRGSAEWIMAGMVFICCAGLGWLLMRKCLRRTENLIGVLTHEKNHPGKEVR